jgi:hypothetical protein
MSQLGMTARAFHRIPSLCSGQASSWRAPSLTLRQAQGRPGGCGGDQDALFGGGDPVPPAKADVIRISEAVASTQGLDGAFGVHVLIHYNQGIVESEKAKLNSVMNAKEAARWGMRGKSGTGEGIAIAAGTRPC